MKLKNVFYRKITPLRKKMIEQNILESLSYADVSYKILEEYLNQEMKSYSQILVEQYKKNPDIYSWDLGKFKRQFKNYDIYIIDQNLKIVRATFEKDLGLDFSKFPNFAKLLRKRMSGNTFYADRIDISMNSFRLKKYSYMPTPDHKYLLELSIDIIESNPVMKDMNVFSRANYLTRNYDLLKQITFYKFNETGSEVRIITQRGISYVDTKIQKNIKETVKKIILTKRPVEINDYSSNGKYTYKYIPYLNYTRDNRLDWWNSYVVELTYDNSFLYSKLAREKRIFAVEITITILLFIMFLMAFRNLLNQTEKTASYDPLTALPNRSFFAEYFKNIIYKRQSDKMAILFIDINDFKMINDTYGHDTGDFVLKKVAEILKRILRKDDLVIRYGGDEFLVLLRGINSLKDVELVVQKINQEINKPFNIHDKTIEISASIGISMYPDNGSTLEELITKADESMYKEKTKQKKA